MVISQIKSKILKQIKRGKHTNMSTLTVFYIGFCIVLGWSHGVMLADKEASFPLKVTEMTAL